MNGSQPGRLFEILVTDDNPADVRLTREALKEGKVGCQLSVARDGVEALAFLRRSGAFAAAPRPDLILLDLNLPKKDGREVLAEIKADPDLKSIPIAVLSTSASPLDVAFAYQNHANCFVTKPIDLEHFLAMVQQLSAFWLQLVELPSRR